MSNIDKAARAVSKALHGDHGGVPWQNDYIIAHALADAGLLAPDLPKPTWEHTDIWVVDDLEIETIGDFVLLEWADGMDDMRGTTTRSLKLDRRMILAILAAADHAEEASHAQDD